MIWLHHMVVCNIVGRLSGCAGLSAPNHRRTCFAGLTSQCPTTNAHGLETNLETNVVFCNTVGRLCGSRCRSKGWVWLESSSATPVWNSAASHRWWRARTYHGLNYHALSYRALCYYATLSLVACTYVPWSAYVQHMGSTWPAHGQRMVSAWSAHGHHMVSAWSAHGQNVVRSTFLTL